MRTGAVLTLLLWCSGCAGVLDPAGEESRDVAVLWWAMLVPATVAVVAVVVLIVVAWARSRRGRHRDLDEARRASLDDPRGHRIVVVCGVVVPAIVLSALFVLSLPTLQQHSRQPTGGGDVIEVTGHRWWWEVDYGAGAETANELHVPVGEPVTIELDSADVIHSFWVPELAGKTDAIPGRPNRMRLTAAEPGTYVGRCAEFCGLQHANMDFVVVAEPRADYERWVDNLSDDARQPTTPEQVEGQQAFLGSACVYCHAVRGTNASSDFGPDLTHLAQRERLAGGVLENNRGSLAGWLLDPQHLKPGNLMPGLDLEPDQLQTILDYLMSLE